MQDWKATLCEPFQRLSGNAFDEVVELYFRTQEAEDKAKLLDAFWEAWGTFASDPDQVDAMHEEFRPEFFARRLRGFASREGSLPFSIYCRFLRRRRYSLTPLNNRYRV